MPNPLKNGTSIAAPHVTGTVALLQEHANNVGWGANARRHEVMKAVLMNSADKKEGILGMERTVRKQNGGDWFSADASMQEFTPLDEEMGAGHLNANRALAQFAPGEHEPGENTTVPNRGWDFGTSSLPDNLTRYRLETPLAAGEHV